MRKSEEEFVSVEKLWIMILWEKTFEHHGKLNDQENKFCTKIEVGFTGVRWK